MRLALVFAALGVGMLLPVQAAVNAALGRVTGYPLVAALTNFCVGMSIIVTLAVTTGQIRGVGALRTAPWWTFGGGLVGASVVLSGILVAPRLGSTVFFVLIIAGQLVAGLALDYFGAFGMPRVPLTAARVAGVVAVAVGVLLMRRG
ncbi:MAG: DMT family transporter [Myxococcales bacterium]|nr:DMT family transporter [Myxococcales bacterium]MCB9520723.1 DMT family transporter [Myxococcales bacterium]MCB9532127.1 DMT family transporter [Myxococcales bacterium]